MKNKIIFLGLALVILLFLPSLQESDARLRSFAQIHSLRINDIPITKPGAVLHTDSDNTIKVTISTTDILNACLFGFDHPRPMQCVPEKVHPGINTIVTWIVKADHAEHKAFHIEIISPGISAKTLVCDAPVVSP